MTTNNVYYTSTCATCQYPTTTVFPFTDLEELFEGALGAEDAGELVVFRPVGELVDGLVRQQVLVHQERLSLGPQDADVQHGHVTLSLYPVQELADLHAELHRVLCLVVAERVRE